MDGNNLENDPKALMDQAKNGDADAFGRLYEIYFAPVFRYIYLRVKDRETTNDLVQVVFLKVFQSIARYEEQNKSPLAYFFTVARNTIIDNWRKKKEITLGDPEEIFARIPDESDSPHTSLEKADITQMVRHAIQRLTEEQQQVIVLKFVNEWPNQDISDFLGKTEEAVRQLQCRAIKALRQQFKELGLL